MNKIYTLIIFIIANTYTSAQIISRNLIDKNQMSSAFGRNLNYDEISGSPYFLGGKFNESKVADGYKNFPVRYNAFKDEIEFQNNDEQIMILPKEEKFKNIEVFSSKQIIALLTFDNEPTGYYFEILAGKFSLYKKIKVNFNDGKPATSFIPEQPASFSDPIISFYIVTNSGEVIKKPKNPKEIIKQIPYKKETLISFFKENKIKFDKENDLQKLVLFLNQN